MCGIAGIVSKREGEALLEMSLKRLTEALKHRGPDGEGHLIDGQVALGHRRLAIIDLQGGQQPISDASGQFVLTYNGELYNFRELRGELEKADHRFLTNCDTEVILHAYMEWGRECVKRFRGMFAFGLYDKAAGEIFLARDPLGIKPLCYMALEDKIAFSSEIKPLADLADRALEVDLQAIDEFLLLSYISAPRTGYKEIRKLKAGHTLVVGVDLKVGEQVPYWQMSFEPDDSKSKSEWLDYLDHVLEESVQGHLVADVDFGAFLSGGLDSSCVVGYMQKAMATKVKTFSIGFEESGFDERSYAQDVTDLFQTDHRSKVVSFDKLPEILTKLVKHYGEPFADNSAIPTSRLCEMAAGEVKMVLSGDGADEIMGGYERYFRWMEFTYQKPEFVQAFNSGCFPDFIQSQPDWRRGDFDRWSSHLRYFDTAVRGRLWGDKWSTVNRPDMIPMIQAFAAGASYGPGHQAQYADIQSYLTDNICVKVDIASMMHSLEVRTPLTDIRLYEALSTIPEEFNLRPELNGAYTGKHLLKEHMAKKFGMSSEFVNRKKAGFVVPLDQWFSQGSPLIPWVSEKLLGVDSGLRKLFDVKTIPGILNEHRGRHLYAILVLEEWLRQSKVTVN